MCGLVVVYQIDDATNVLPYVVGHCFAVLVARFLELLKEVERNTNGYRLVGLVFLCHTI